MASPESENSATGVAGGCGICQLRALRDGEFLLIMAFYFAGVHPLYQYFHTHRWMFLSLVNCCTIDWFTEWSRLVQWYSHDGSWDFSGRLFSYFSCNIHVHCNNSSNDSFEGIWFFFG